MVDGQTFLLLRELSQDRCPNQEINREGGQCRHNSPACDLALTCSAGRMAHERLGLGPFRHRKITYNLCFSFTYGKCQRIEDKIQLALQDERFKIGSGIVQARQDAHDLAAAVAIERVLGVGQTVMGFDLGDVTDFGFPEAIWSSLPSSLASHRQLGSNPKLGLCPNGQPLTQQNCGDTLSGVGAQDAT